jgi:hypothetical protein
MTASSSGFSETSMRRLMVSVLMLVSGQAAAAMWVPIGENSNFINYYDPATISRSGSMVTLMVLFDEKAPRQSASGRSYLSSKTLSEYDCQGGRWRMLSTTFHSRHMGFGEVVYRGKKLPEWTVVPPGSIVESQWKFACGQK